ncbi:hypothetical protein NQ318_007115 [Aromia moschata]|uniref:Uncharacterized protein n=1 Tax=Aromia moschata TaxID=1265417 RepID=A0AAV8X650_9CUCU|nr:hypothetical protein NQ318_007115 [Aromia moschata]
MKSIKEIFTNIKTLLKIFEVHYFVSIIIIINHYCCVPRCLSWVKRDPQLTFHIFLEQEKHQERIDKRKAWIIKLRIGKPVRKLMRVCSLHLAEEDYFYRLKKEITEEECYSVVINKFNEKYPEVSISNVGAKKLVTKFLETGSVLDIKKSKKLLNEDDAASVLAIHSVREAPILSLRRRAIETEISKSHLQRIFKQNRILPVKPKFRHTLEDGDEAKRLYFCLEMGSRVLNDIVCIIGLVFIEFVAVYYDRWVLEMLLIGLGGYILICACLLVVSVQDDEAPELLDQLFMIVGALLNILGGVMTLISNIKNKGSFLITSGVHNHPGENYEIFVVIFALVAGGLMLADFIRAILKKGGD